tara:strand:+ start:1913 stop:2071 length:159 start_codon:yes stop_codon:yes gene_type:complete
LGPKEILPELFVVKDSATSPVVKIIPASNCKVAPAIPFEKTPLCVVVPVKVT